MQQKDCLEVVLLSGDDPCCWNAWEAFLRLRVAWHGMSQQQPLAAKGELMAVARDLTGAAGIEHVTVETRQT